MPFTLAHGAAALPFRWRWVVPSALVVGAFAPDFEYFLWMAPRSGFGHSWPGVLLLTLPLGLAALWLFHTLVKVPATGLLPERLQRRLDAHLQPFRWSGAWRFCEILSSMLLGIATHVFWDWFTHRGSWLYGRWAFLRSEEWLPLAGRVPHYKLFQHGSTLVGLTLVAVWCVRWYRRAEVRSHIRRSTTVARRTVLCGVIGGAMAGTAIRVLAFGGGSLAAVAGQSVCAFVALVWWELVVYGALRAWRNRV